MLSVGKILHQERIKKGYPLSLIEKQIKVRERFLHAIEQDNWKSFSSKIYIIGIIKNYASFLGLDENKILAFFRREYDSDEEIRFKGKVASKYLISDTKTVIYICLGLIFLFFLFYFGFQISLFLAPPKITILQPKITTFKHVEKIKIIGKTEKEASITIFGERIYQNKDGFFEYELPLKKGNNSILIEVVGANGKKTMFTETYVKSQ